MSRILAQARRLENLKGARGHWRGRRALFAPSAVVAAGSNELDPG
jgi:hypothetical protein